MTQWVWSTELCHEYIAKYTYKAHLFNSNNETDDVDINRVSEQFSSYIMARTSYIQWHDVHFVLNQQAQLDFKQQPTSKHVAPLGHIILTPSQPVFALTPECCVLSRETTNTNFIVFGSSNPRSTTPKTSTLTITQSMRFILINNNTLWIIPVVVTFSELFQSICSLSSHWFRHITKCWFTIQV